MAWFSDSKNRAEAIKIMVDAGKLKQADVEKSYDFLHKNEFFENTGKVSRAKMSALLKALKELGDVEGSTDVARFVLPGVTQLSD
jgi:NitT/TauT family transport system substrate-binding protein